jgi:hypothetical protein
VGQLGVQVAQHRADDALTGQDAAAWAAARRGTAGRRAVGWIQVLPEGHDVAVAVVDGGGDFRAWCHYRGAPAGQELDYVEFALQPGGRGTDGGGARGYLGYYRGGAQVHDHVGAVGEDDRVVAVDAQAGGDLDGGVRP